jgi:hypothetical protein
VVNKKKKRELLILSLIWTYEFTELIHIHLTSIGEDPLSHLFSCFIYALLSDECASIEYVFYFLSQYLFSHCHSISSLPNFGLILHSTRSLWTRLRLPRTFLTVSHEPTIFTTLPIRFLPSLSRYSTYFPRRSFFRIMQLCTT